MVESESDSIARRAAFVACLSLFAFDQITTILFNGSLEVVQRPIVDQTRDYATILQAFLMVSVALIARNRPSAVSLRWFTAVGIACAVVGAMLTGIGVARVAPALVVAGTCLRSGALAWTSVVTLILCSQLPFRHMFVCLAGGGLIGTPVALICAQAGYFAQLAIYGFATVAALVWGAILARPYFEGLAHIEAPADAEVTRPRSVLPLTQDMFVYIFVFYFSYGFAMRYELADGGLIAHWLVLLVLLALMAYALQTRYEPHFDTLFKGAFTLLFAGYLLVLIDDPELAQTTSLLLVCSSTVFGVLMNLVLAAVASRNPANSIPTIAWGYAVHFAGIELGAQLGIAVTAALPDDQFAARAAVAVVLGAITLYTLFSIRDFGFDKTIAEIEPGEPLQIPAEVRYIDVVGERCQELCEQHGLTERESEVFGLLARGHNTLYIQDTLCISKNTLKYHVRHIYEKCDVHSQQELIELL